MKKTISIILLVLAIVQVPIYILMSRHARIVGKEWDTNRAKANMTRVTHKMTSNPPTHFQDGRNLSLSSVTLGLVNATSKPTIEPMTLCPADPPNLVGKVPVQTEDTKTINLTSILHQTLQENPDVMPGGTWKPGNCSARSRVLVIIPYRDRREHLLRWLRHHLPILRRQQIEWRIVVTEQYGNGTFNKGRIMNAAYKEAKKQFQFDCILFHDVDMLLEDDRNLYRCSLTPTHLSPALDKWNYTLKYKRLIGGVLIFPNQHFKQVNGYSNAYWGWGGEDDDMYERLTAENIEISRSPIDIGRYTMMSHVQRGYVLRDKMMHLLLIGARRRYHWEGLKTLKYKIVSKSYKKLYTHFVFNIGKMPQMKKSRYIPRTKTSKINPVFEFFDKLRKSFVKLLF